MKGFYFALQHLTRIRIYNGEFDRRAFGRSPVFFPAVGLVLAGLVLLAKLLFDMLFPPPLAAACVVIAIVALTGGMHLDGLMDTMDGMCSGRPREIKLAIMKDSRVGAFGILGLACLLLLKFAVFLSMPWEQAVPVILLAMVFSRWAMVYAIARFPYARQEGLGLLYSMYTGKKELLLASACTFVIAAAVAGAAGLVILVLTWAWAYCLGCRVSSHLGGLTGDVYGAVAETTELVVYAVSMPVYEYLPALFHLPPSIAGLL